MGNDKVCGQGRDGRGRWVIGEDSPARDAEALRRRARNHTYQQISDALGYGSHANVVRAIKAALDRIISPAVEEYRRIMDLQLDELQAAAQKILDRRHPVLYQGVAVEHDGKTIVDDGPALQAIATLVKIMDRRARLWGLDSAVKFEAAGHTLPDLARAIEDFRRELTGPGAAA